MTGYMEACHWCLDRRCDGCPLPFVSDMTYNDLLIKLGSSSNDSYYASDAYKRGKQDVILDVVWSQRTQADFFSAF